MKQLPPFKVVLFEQTDMLNDTGDDIVFFDARLRINEQLYHYSLPFSKLKSYLLVHKPEKGTYLDKLRASINGFGPKETVVIRLAEEEGFDIEKEAMDFIENTCTMESLMPLTIQRSNAEAAAFEEQMQELDALAQEGKSFNLRNIAFKDQLIDMLNKKVLEIYPEIINSSPEHITKLQDLLVRHVTNFAGEVNSLAWKAHKDM